jgi:hypothetical protein
LAAGWLLAALPAAAQTVPDGASEEQKQTARDHYATGKTAFEAKKYDEALAAFEQSYAAVASPNTKLMIARCLAQLSRNAEAYEAFGATMRDAQASGDPKYAPAAQAAESERAALGARVGMVKVFVGGDPSGTALSVQGRPVPAERAGEPVAVDPGPVEVVLTRADGSTDVRSVTVVAGQAADVEVDATPPAPPPEAVAEPMVDEAPDTEDEGRRLTDRANTGIVLGGKIGAGLGKPMSEFGASYVLELEVGWMLPVLDRSLEVFVTGQYTRPKITDIEGEAGPRLPGDGVPHAEITQDELALTLGLLYRFHVGLDWLAPYGGAGARLYMQRTTVKGSAGGESFGSNEETQSDAGLLLLGGVDFGLGPGALLAELQFGWAKLDGFVLRDTNAGALRLLVGYRAML